ncbi:TrmH family RNA methyltransferase [Mycetocola reblochoni]|uniref:Putative rRNA methylase n=1 Tax=Mycetocola reblochoni REB411 TaxID=1255698 RepID=A0A1R4J5P9_9MICO|nr:RNA methyltransferase [Mycetocola reblochoni]SJN27352.1 putative rRNA methylase [Mycetocola reblochoni REB411]
MNIIPAAEAPPEALLDYTSLTDVALRKALEPEGGLYIAESAKVIDRAISAGHRPRSVLARERWLPQIERALAASPDVPVYVGDDDFLESLTGFHLHRGALAAMHRPELADPADLLRDARRVVVIEDVVDHTNVGAIFRAAAGIGADAVLVTPRCADPLYRRSVRVSMGTVLQVPWTRLPEWPEAEAILHDAGFHIMALALDERAVTLDEAAANAPERIALVLGSEGDGLSRRALASADSTVMIPMLHGVDSLNVAAASAVALWALRPRDGEQDGRDR